MNPLALKVTKLMNSVRLDTFRVMGLMVAPLRNVYFDSVKYQVCNLHCGSQSLWA